jgi:rod shape-determining protein MreD
MPRLFSGKVILYLLILLILDICLMPALGAFRPILTYLWILYIAFHVPSEILAAAVLTGIFRDLFGSQPLGIETAGLVAVSSGLLFFMQKLEREFFPMRMAGAMIFVFSALLMNLTLASFLSPTPQFSFAAVGACFASAFISGLIMPVFFFITDFGFKDSVRNLRQYELFG